MIFVDHKLIYRLQRFLVTAVSQLIFSQYCLQIILHSIVTVFYFILISVRYITYMLFIIFLPSWRIKSLIYNYYSFTRISPQKGECSSPAPTEYML